MLNILSHPRHEEYKEMFEWYSSMPGPKIFNSNETNACLKKLKWDFPDIEDLYSILEERDAEIPVSRNYVDKNDSTTIH